MSDDASKQSCLTKVNIDKETEINNVGVDEVDLPEDCWCQVCRKKCTCCIRMENTAYGKRWWAFRCKMYFVVRHSYFETFIIIMILASSLALISLIMLGAEAMGVGNVGAFKAMRTLRALRPLRAVSRWEGMRVVVNALIKAIPSIANVLLVCLVFWLIFGIVGVQFFSGKFFKCMNYTSMTRIDASIVPDRNVCLYLKNVEHENVNWVNSPINFDNVGNAYLSLLQVIKIIGWIFDCVTDQKFDIGIMIIIMANMVSMALEHHNMSETMESALDWINLSFIVIFTLECILKIIGLRHYYFKIPWNIFDFVVVVLSILGVAMRDFMDAFFVSPTLLRVVRVFRVGLLLFLVMFIYATFGMNFFMKVKHTGGLDDAFNFETFGRSVIILFEMCTSAGWDGVLTGLMNEEDCDNEVEKNCGNYGLAVFYLVSYLVMSFLVVVNMYIAVILENFSQATEDVQQGLTPDDFDMYYEKWEKYDPGASGYISLRYLADFVDYLEEPLRLPKPNHFLLVKLDIPICEDDMVNCKDILDALTKNFLNATDTAPIQDMGDREQKEGKKLVVVSSTLLRQKENYAAKEEERSNQSDQKVQEKTLEDTVTIVDETTGKSKTEEPASATVATTDSKAVELRPDSGVVA
ncbi:hypothetical protein KUTeg_014427 [Tegillarca granosa]|uniref:Sodium channel protein n=1 Tax=Tegillarca granosa TaxID=220873 RepID=A0ABQ9F1X5_TEGGR|nr:hypothetical protein KUTeg_014427 [Tegillarca granosa]